MEAHLLDFKGDLYGEEMEIIFQEKLREEKKFPSLAAFKEQIARDIAVGESAILSLERHLTRFQSKSAIFARSLLPARVPDPP